MDRYGSLSRRQEVGITVALFMLEQKIYDHIEIEWKFPSVISVSWSIYKHLKAKLGPELDNSLFFWGVKVITSSQEDPIKVIS